MPIARVQHTTKDAGSVTSTTLAYGSNPAANNLLLVIVRAGGTTALPFTVSDTLGNTWHGLTSNTISGIGSLQMFWAVNGSSGANTVTVSISGVAQTLRLAIYEYSGAATVSPADLDNNSATGSGTTPAAVSITPSGNGELIISFAANGATTTYSAGTNFALDDVVPAAPSSKLGVEEWVQTTATATTGPFTIASDTWMCAIASFKPGAAFQPDEDYWPVPVPQPIEPVISVW